MRAVVVMELSGGGCGLGNPAFSAIRAFRAIPKARRRRKAGHPFAHPRLGRVGRGLREDRRKALGAGGDVEGEGRRQECVVEELAPGPEALARARDDDGARGREALLERGEQASEPVRVAIHLRPEEGERAVGGFGEAHLARDEGEAAERPRRDAIARRRRVVRPGLRAMDELLVAVRREEEAAFLAVLEFLEEPVAELGRPLQVLDAKSACSISRSAARRNAWSSR
jgi:hypothetical protein